MLTTGNKRQKWNFGAKINETWGLVTNEICCRSPHSSSFNSRYNKWFLWHKPWTWMSEHGRQTKKTNTTCNGLKMAPESWHSFHRMVRYFPSPCIWAEWWFPWPTVHGGDSRTPVGLTFKRTGTSSPASCRSELPLLISLTALMERPQSPWDSMPERERRPAEPTSLLALPAKACEWHPLGYSRPVQPSAE